jgi:hypothetical protein
MASINEALPIYLGVGVSSFPKKSVARLVASFGHSEAARLAAEADALIAELSALTPDWSRHSLVSGTDWAITQLRRAHPDLDDAAARALDWEFSYGWK